MEEELAMSKEEGVDEWKRGGSRDGQKERPTGLMCTVAAL